MNWGDMQCFIRKVYNRLWGDQPIDCCSKQTRNIALLSAPLFLWLQSTYHTEGQSATSIFSLEIHTGNCLRSHSSPRECLAATLQLAPMYFVLWNCRQKKMHFGDCVHIMGMSASASGNWLYCTMYKEQAQFRPRLHLNCNQVRKRHALF